MLCGFCFDGLVCHFIVQDGLSYSMAIIVSKDVKTACPSSSAFIICHWIVTIAIYEWWVVYNFKKELILILPLYVPFKHNIWWDNNMCTGEKYDGWDPYISFGIEEGLLLLLMHTSKAKRGDLIRPAGGSSMDQFEATLLLAARLVLQAVPSHIYRVELATRWSTRPLSFHIVHDMEEAAAMLVPWRVFDLK